MLWWCGKTPTNKVNFLEIFLLSTLLLSHILGHSLNACTMLSINAVDYVWVHRISLIAQWGKSSFKESMKYGGRKRLNDDTNGSTNWNLVSRVDRSITWLSSHLLLVLIVNKLFFRNEKSVRQQGRIASSQQAPELVSICEAIFWLT